MSIMYLMGPVFLDAGIKTALAPAEEFWENMGRKSPSDNLPTPATAAKDEQDRMSMSAGIKAA